MRIISQELQKLPVTIIHISLGVISLSFDHEKVSLKTIVAVLEKEGFPVIVNREKILVEQIKTAIIELIHSSGNKSSIIRNSDYLVERLGVSYSVLFTVFSKHEGMNIEKFIIIQKIEKVKELLDHDGLTLNEIAHNIGCCGVQHLSALFKSTTGISVMEYKKSLVQRRKRV